MPSHLAYGKRGAGLDIGADETLIFEVELLKVWED
jgi:FKBP-type peptidyl-prolyl cis-trans isomerase FklB